MPLLSALELLTTSPRPAVAHRIQQFGHSASPASGDGLCHGRPISARQLVRKPEVALPPSMMSKHHFRRTSSLAILGCQ